jgi:dihydroflavonol-4-reductase
VRREGDSLELAVINPVGVFGPVLGREVSTSTTLIQRLLDHGMPALPRLSVGLVDVRDVAELRLRAMTDPSAAGERFLAVADEPTWIRDIARVLRNRLSAAGERVPTRQAPDLLVRLASRADPSLRAYIHELGKVKRASAEKAHRVLGWEPRSNEDVIIASAEACSGTGS